MCKTGHIHPVSDPCFKNQTMPVTTRFIRRFSRFIINSKSGAVYKFCPADIRSSAEKNYYCFMRDLLKTALGKQLILPNGSKYMFVIARVEVLNALGTVAAVLDEYLITSEDGTTYKLHKTKEGNWYNPEGQNHVSEQPVLQQLKRAIDAQVKEVSA
jgi:hypothetical protein